jgi:hypothetical protein
MLCKIALKWIENLPLNKCFKLFLNPNPDSSTGLKIEFLNWEVHLCFPGTKKNSFEDNKGNNF